MVFTAMPKEWKVAINLGGRNFDKNASEVKLVLKPRESIVFKHKVVIGGDLTDAEVNEMAKKF